MMKPNLEQAAMAVLLSAAALSAQAGSLAASSAAGGSSASVGSSASSEASSDGSSASSGGRQKAAAGPYRITTVADVAERPGQLRLELQALADDAPAPAHVLVLPRAVVLQFQLTAGQTITARPQAYGTEFVHDASRVAFFLVLTDRYQRELAAQPVRL